MKETYRTESCTSLGLHEREVWLRLQSASHFARTRMAALSRSEKRLTPLVAGLSPTTLSTKNKSNGRPVVFHAISATSALWARQLVRLMAGAVVCIPALVSGQQSVLMDAAHWEVVDFHRWPANAPGSEFKETNGRKVLRVFSGVDRKSTRLNSS